jgi:hypothetical protein
MMDETQKSINPKSWQFQIADTVEFSEHPDISGMQETVNMETQERK